MKKLHLSAHHGHRRVSAGAFASAHKLPVNINYPSFIKKSTLLEWGAVHQVIWLNIIHGFSYLVSSCVTALWYTVHCLLQSRVKCSFCFSVLFHFLDAACFLLRTWERCYTNHHEKYHLAHWSGCGHSRPPAPACSLSRSQIVPSPTSHRWQYFISIASLLILDRKHNVS